MILTQQQQHDVWGVLIAIGHPLDAEHMTMSPEAVDWLIMRCFIENSDGGLQFTDKGWHAHKVLETGEGTIPEIDGPDLEV